MFRRRTKREKNEWMTSGRTSVDTYNGAVVYIHCLYQLCGWRARWQHHHTYQPQPQLCTASHGRHVRKYKQSYFVVLTCAHTDDMSTHLLWKTPPTDRSREVNALSLRFHPKSAEVLNHFFFASSHWLVLFQGLLTCWRGRGRPDRPNHRKTNGQFNQSPLGRLISAQRSVFQNHYRFTTFRSILR